MSLKILILGAGGFIGNSLVKTILDHTDWKVYGFDRDESKLEGSLGHKRFHFHKGDVFQNQKWIEEHVSECDVVLPLIAIANPAFYVTDPLRVFRLDFESNLDVIKLCVRYKKRIIFPSTSEVYGMSTDTMFDEEKTNFVLGPTSKQRWIYSCSKQLLDRVIYAYGLHEQLNYTIFRPFNWLGPKMDDIFSEKEGQSRAIIQFISNVLHGRPIKLVDGGAQRRCFTYVEEGVDGLMRMIENKNKGASQRIFNLGNPHNNLSMREAAEQIISVMKEHPTYASYAHNARIEAIDSKDHFGDSYQDVQARVPSIKNAETFLGWSPSWGFRDILKKILEYHLDHNPAS